MARHEADREDLMREATALVERAELRIADEPVTLVIGFRRDGGISFYFDADYVIQFNPAREIRRLYYDGRLIKAEAGRLVALRRRRTAAAVQLQRHELTAEESATCLHLFAWRIFQLRFFLAQGRITWLAEVPAGCGVAERIGNWLADVSLPFVIAQSPHAGGSR